MELSPVFFYLFAGLAIACALMVVLKKNPVASAFSLIVVFFSFAAIYALLGAHLIAALQVLVYAGAVMVLFVFVIMLLNAGAPSFDLRRSPLAIRVGAVACVGVLLALMIAVFKGTPTALTQGPFTREAVAQAGGNSRVIAELLFSEYILPFELTSVLLLAAIVGVVAIAMRNKKSKGAV